MQQKQDKFDRLINWFGSTNSLFEEFRHYTLDHIDKEKRRVFIDNKGNILFVAHIDTVQKPRYFRQHNGKLYASGLDDRLGCWLAYTLSKELKADLLLCDNEEWGESTALYHNCKDYNWIAEFDRGNGDVVTYDLDSSEFRKALKAYFEIGFGAFSDISFLKTSACCVNIGLGYYKAHSKGSYADLRITQKQIEKFKKFYQQYKNVVFERDLYCEPFIDGFGYQAKRLDYISDSYIECDICGYPGIVVYGHILCQNCFEEIVSNYFDLCYGE